MQASRERAVRARSNMPGLSWHALPVAALAAALPVPYRSSALDRAHCTAPIIVFFIARSRPSSIIDAKLASFHSAIRVPEHMAEEKPGLKTWTRHFSFFLRIDNVYSCDMDAAFMSVLVFSPSLFVGELLYMLTGSKNRWKLRVCSEMPSHVRDTYTTQTVSVRLQKSMVFSCDGRQKTMF